jgi:hypothetical protein
MWRQWQLGAWMVTATPWSDAATVDPQDSDSYSMVDPHDGHNSTATVDPTWRWWLHSDGVRPRSRLDHLLLFFKNHFFVSVRLSNRHHRWIFLVSVHTNRYVDFLYRVNGIGFWHWYKNFFPAVTINIFYSSVVRLQCIRDVYIPDDDWWPDHPAARGTARRRPTLVYLHDVRERNELVTGIIIRSLAPRPPSYENGP